MILGIICAVVIIGGIIFLAQNKKSASESPTPSAVTTKSPTTSILKTSVPKTNNDTGNSAGFSTLRNAYESGNSLKCTIDTTSQKFVYYFKDGNMRYKSSVTSGATSIEAEIIIKKNISYSWTNMSSNIVTTTDPKTIEFTRNAAFQLDTLLNSTYANIKLACEQTNISASLFDKP